MAEYKFNGWLYVPKDEPLEFQGFFERKPKGTLEGIMAYHDARATDIKNQVIGQLYNQDGFNIPHPNEPNKDVLVLFHTRNCRDADTIYFLSKKSCPGFSGLYSGKKVKFNAALNFDYLQKTMDIFENEKMVSNIKGIKAEILLQELQKV